MSARMILAVYLAMSRPVAKRFWITMRAAFSGSIAAQLGPFAEMMSCIRVMVFW